MITHYIIYKIYLKKKQISISFYTLFKWIKKKTYEQSIKLTLQNNNNVIILFNHCLQHN